jgi:hypothetical protein
MSAYKKSVCLSIRGVCLSAGTVTSLCDLTETSMVDSQMNSRLMIRPYIAVQIFIYLISGAVWIIFISSTTTNLLSYNNDE